MIKTIIALLLALSAAKPDVSGKDWSEIDTMEITYIYDHIDVVLQIIDQINNDLRNRQDRFEYVVTTEYAKVSDLDILLTQLDALSARIAVLEGGGCDPVTAAKCTSCRSGWDGDGGVRVVDGVCQNYCSVKGYCGTAEVYQDKGTDCSPCAASSLHNSTYLASLSIIIPVVIAAVLLLAAVLYLVRKRRVAAATPDEAPQLDTEVQVEA